MAGNVENGAGEETRTIVLALAAGEVGSILLTYALKNVWRPGDKMILVHVRPEVDRELLVAKDYLHQLEAQAIAKGRGLLESYGKTIDAYAKAKSRDITYTMRLEVGDPREKIVEFLEEIKANLVIIGNRDLGLIKRTLLGSVSQHIAHHSPCEVLIIKAPSRRTSIDKTLNHSE